MNPTAEPEPNLRPWDRQPGEGEAAYQAFVAYRDSGVPRNLAATARALDKYEAQLYRWKETHRWQTRLLAFDSAQSRTAEESGRQEGERKRRRWRQATDHVMQAVLAGLLGYIVQDPETGRTVLDSRLPLKQRLQIGEFLLKVQARLEEAPEGEQTPQGIESELRRMADEELRKLKQFASQDDTHQEVSGHGTAKRKRPRRKQKPA